MSHFIAEFEKLINNEEEINKIVDDCFTQADTDQSGEISLDEFLVAFKNSLKNLELPPPTQEQSQEVFNELDADKSGRLDKQEFKVFVIRTFRLMAKILSEL